MRAIERLDTLLEQPVHTRSLGLVRILVGAITLLHLWPFLSEVRRGDFYRDRFHHPYPSPLPDPSKQVYIVVVSVGLIAALALTLGVVTRVAAWSTFSVVAYNLSLSTTNLHNNRAYLVTVLLILALAPSGRSLSVDAFAHARREPDFDRTTPGWTLWLLRFVSAVTYGASGLSKLLDPDWFGGRVTWGRVVVQEAMVRDSLLPSAIADMLLDRSFHTFAAKAIVLTELFIASGLWWPRTRRLAIAAAICFHVTIEFSAEVQVFSLLGLAVLFAWADPSLPWLGQVLRRWAPRRREIAGAGT
jgi:uncharacterized membrane protein YphA (DoxX/SURF4 family)